MTAERTIEAQIRSASRIEPDKLPRLKLLGDAWADAAAEAFGEFCTSPVEIECLGVSSLVLSKGAPEIGEVAFATVLRSPKWTEIGALLADPAASDIFAEAIFGGVGKGWRGPRPATALDRRLTEKGLSSFAETANAVFAEIAPLDIRPDVFLSSTIAEELDDLLAKDARGFVVMTFGLKLGDMASTLRAAIPEKAFAMHRRKLAVVPERAAPAVDETWAKNIQEGLQLADLQVRALLDERQITLGEVASFAVGQTIVLDATMESLIVVECEEQRLFRGRIGMTRDAYMVRIEEKIDPTEEFIDDILAD
ncbi:FliM/FliN family flagellar motor switch protein [Aureimonas psammosilenae]|uniref:FliM/FliN family flagellar motor switch protein n=1 Tax=Aureimonas psammosilenae TaxID=2495496 RepID=UPI001869C0BF|nr:FliM/FliN family flagellar motor switch protein [Aureimonas psammosilenae]